MSKELTKEQVTVEKLIPDINAAHKAFITSGQETLEYARQIGNDLLKIKECVKHGEWENLIESRFDFTPQSASGYMKLAAGWSALKGKDATETATIGGCLKLIGQTRNHKGGNRKSPSISPKPAESNGKHSQAHSPQPAHEKEPDKSPEASDKSDGPLNDEPEKELSFGERVKAENGKIESFCRNIVKCFEDGCPKLASVDHLGRYDSALAQIRAACSTLRTCKYHDEPCPACKGEGCKKCEKESDFGAVTVLTYRQLAG